MEQNIIMAEDIKGNILNFLKNHPNKRFSVTQLQENVDTSYSTCLKWVEVLIAEEAIKVEDYGNVKQVWCE